MPSGIWALGNQQPHEQGSLVDHWLTTGGQRFLVHQLLRLAAMGRLRAFATGSFYPMAAAEMCRSLMPV